MRKKTKEEFINDARDKHGDKYDYSKVNYVNNATKVCIICPEHGEFWQIPSNHLQGQGCHKCSGNFLYTKEEWISSAHEKHHGKYDYSKVDYVNSRTKICIVCPEHGEFWQTPNHHLSGCGCHKCGVENVREILTSSKEEFIKKARSKHGDKYDYTKVNYVDSKTKVCIICPKHGEFWQIPANHIQGAGCSKCSGCYEPTTEEWIVSARKLHGDKYDYSKVEYVGVHNKVCIICPEHGEFWQTPNEHKKGCGCPKCVNRCVYTTEEWITSARKVHGDKYDYTKVNYVNSRTKICIICPEHGEFWQEAISHLRGCGCPKCGGSYVPTKEEWIASINKVHNGKYDYSKVKYINANTKICIICPKHGEFWQKPKHHTQGAGCPKCNLSHLERGVMNYLDEVGITYDYQKRFNWLGLQSLDFYLPDYNVGVECQGEQHFFPVDFAGKGVEWACKHFDKLISRDKRKKALCEEHGIKLLYFGNVPNYDTFLGEVVHDDVQYLIDYLNEHKLDEERKCLSYTYRC